MKPAVIFIGLCVSCVFMWLLYLPSALGSYDSLCRQMAADLDAVVVTVEWVYTFIRMGRENSSVVLISHAECWFCAVIAWLLMCTSQCSMTSVWGPLSISWGQKCWWSIRSIQSEWQCVETVLEETWPLQWLSGYTSALLLNYFDSLWCNIVICHHVSFKVIFSVKEMVLLKIKHLSLFTHPQVVPNLYDFILCNTKGILKNCSVHSFYAKTMHGDWSFKLWKSAKTPQVS